MQKNVKKKKSSMASCCKRVFLEMKEVFLFLRLLTCYIAILYYNKVDTWF